MADVTALLLACGLAVSIATYCLGYVAGRGHRTVIERASKPVGKSTTTWLPSEHREASLRRAVETGVARAIYGHQHKHLP
jgi:hypothetical protein